MIRKSINREKEISAFFIMVIFFTLPTAIKDIARNPVVRIVGSEKKKPRNAQFSEYALSFQA
jgi:hypothetical protein